MKKKTTPAVELTEAPATPVPVLSSRNKKLALSMQSCASESGQVPAVVPAMKNVGKEQATFASL